MASSRINVSRRTEDHAVLRDWHDALQESKALAVLVLGPVPFAANDDREVIAVYPEEFRSPANALARSAAYGSAWRQSNASLVAYKNFAGSSTAHEPWMESWVERGACGLVRVELPMPLNNGYECFVFTARALSDRSEAADIAWSALSVWPLIKQAFILERFDISPRERQILIVLAAGLTARDAARTLEISERTINFHLSNLMNKLRADNRTEVVQRACSLGLI